MCQRRIFGVGFWRSLLGSQATSLLLCNAPEMTTLYLSLLELETIMKLSLAGGPHRNSANPLLVALIAVALAGSVAACSRRTETTVTTAPPANSVDSTSNPSPTAATTPAPNDRAGSGTAGTDASRMAPAATPTPDSTAGSTSATPPNSTSPQDDATKK